MKIYSLFFCILFSPLIIACGQQGPLYLPGDEPPIHVEPKDPLQEQETDEQS